MLKQAVYIVTTVLQIVNVPCPPPHHCSHPLKFKFEWVDPWQSHLIPIYPSITFLFRVCVCVCTSCLSYVTSCVFLVSSMLIHLGFPPHCSFLQQLIIQLCLFMSSQSQCYCHACVTYVHITVSLISQTFLVVFLLRSCLVYCFSFLSLLGHFNTFHIRNFPGIILQILWQSGKTLAT
jgi:hypothetical protein